MTARALLAAVVGVLALVAAFASIPAGAHSTACPTVNHPNELVIEGGSGQTAQLGKPFSENLQVALANTNGCALTGNLGGINLHFDAPGSGASGVFATGSIHAIVGTDSQGVATAPTLTANFTAGAYTVDVTSDYGTVELYLWNTAAGVAAAIAGGTPAQEANVNAQFAQPLQARVLDADGNPVQGATVDFSVVPGVTGASATLLGQPSATTDANGVATSPPLLANAIPGRYAATASTAGVATIATYTLDNHATAATLSSPVGLAQTATVGTDFGRRLVASVLDASGQPIEGATVAFAITPAAGGAAATFAGGAVQATAITGVDGVATSPVLIANKTAGTFSATATSTLAQTPLLFALRNVAGAPATVTAGAASGDTALPGKRFPVRLAVTVTDKDGNPVAGAIVTFRAPPRGATGFFVPGPHRRVSVARVRTNAAGIAVAPPFIANRKTGGYAVSATTAGKRAAFALRNERS